MLDFALGWFFRLFNRGFGSAPGLTPGSVGRLLRLSLLVLVVYGGLVWLTYWTFQQAPIGFVPEQDRVG